LDAILGALIEAGRPSEHIYNDLAEVLQGQDLQEARTALPRLLGLISNTEFKRRQLPFVVNVTHSGFGAGRKMPLAKEPVAKP
jgi:hypothetical protein